jgi:serine/threonine-protein kinase
VEEQIDGMGLAASQEPASESQIEGAGQELEAGDVAALTPAGTPLPPGAAVTLYVVPEADGGEEEPQVTTEAPPTTTPAPTTTTAPPTTTSAPATTTTATTTTESTTVGGTSPSLPEETPTEEPEDPDTEAGGPGGAG